MKKLIFIFISLITITQAAIAQPVTGSYKDEDEDDPYEHKSYFMFGLNYLSDNVYLGRKDSVALPYISPYIGYHFSNGLYGKLMVSDAPTLHRIDLATLEAGYDHSFGDHFNMGAYADKFYYNKNSNSIRSSSKGCLGAYGQFSNDWIEPQLSWDFNFNKASTDYVLGLQLDHDFDIANHTWHIVPAIGINYGTQHYYDEYFINRLTKKDKTIKVKKVLANANNFVPLDYEFSIKVTYRITKWLFTLTPTYAIPTSPSTITLPNRIVTEKLSNSFYMELDICHR